MGARVFILSGAVGDDPLVFIKAHPCRIGFDLAQWNGNGTCSVTRRVRLRAAHIHDDGFAAIERGFRIFHRNTRNIGFRLRDGVLRLRQK